jgi:hypothetical protein
MYKISQDTLILTLVRTGTHSDLFEWDWNSYHLSSGLSTFFVNYP